MKSLYIFTSAFPYSTIENFLEVEINYHVKYFDSVHIIPLAGKGTCREVPSKCHVYKPIFGEGIQTFIQKYKDILCFRAIPVEVSELFSSHAYRSKRKFLNWLKFSLDLNRFYHNKEIRKIRQQIRKDDVCYFYWGVGANLLSLILRDKCHLVSRFHGEWDLWEEMYGGYLPFRRRVAGILDCSAFISKIGKNYFDARYPNHETAVFPLGTENIGISPQSSDGVIRLLSCSSIYPLKRVDLICDVAEFIANQKIRVEWTHIGGGRDFEQLQKKVKSIDNPYLSIKLLGQVSSDGVKRYYENETIDVFINLSTNEGVPVSIMEATSCNVSVVATNVGATSEVVGKQCGILVSPNPTIKEVSDAVIDVVKRKEDFHPRSYWMQNYNASVNYDSFANMLFNL